ncbi:hypothetical protein M231_04416 [Tremella mesenterica]|uniref:Uncharacterized protein n=1 Tax=Tremella mesenterica TaxID=5217 RepID=A0A4Q1BKG6_TREME|nr:uncharacterized protein TREMEDRAFT_61064 [Tremella mesenterica DSM 1558]EIW70559.1 hypothetical protein TREMEDRAFT_61064 [Tremella mesenterica DSM 1558]RXK38244.1 hypothetical protein M231_04416 [Tremella mesenterica]
MDHSMLEVVLSEMEPQDPNLEDLDIQQDDPVPMENKPEGKEISEKKEKEEDEEKKFKSLSPLFTNSEYESILEVILSDTSATTLSRMLRVSRDIHRLIITSPKLQYRLRCQFHTIESEPDLSGNVNLKLENLIEDQRRLDRFIPREISCLHVPTAEVVDVQDNKMLMLESNSRKPLCTCEVHPRGGYVKDSFSVWQLRSKRNLDTQKIGVDENTNVDDVKEGAICISRVVLDYEIKGIAFCPEEEIVAVVGPCMAGEGDLPFGNKLTIRRINLYHLYPEPETNIPRIHPKAKIPIIEFVCAEDFSLSESIDMQLIKGGRIGVLNPCYSAGATFTAVWDWQKGICLGSASPMCGVNLITSFRFLTPDWLICGVYETGERIHNIDESSVPEDEIFPCLATFATLPLENGKGPSIRQHRIVRTDTTQEEMEVDLDNEINSTPCTWYSFEIPHCIALAGFCFPPLNVRRAQLEGIQDGVVDTEERFTPTGLDIDLPSPILPTFETSSSKDHLAFYIKGRCGVEGGDQAPVAISGSVPVSKLYGLSIPSVFMLLEPDEGFKVKYYRQVMNQIGMEMMVEHMIKKQTEFESSKSQETEKETETKIQDDEEDEDMSKDEDHSEEISVDKMNDQEDISDSIQNQDQENEIKVYQDEDIQIEDNGTNQDQKEDHDHEHEHNDDAAQEHGHAHEHEHDHDHHHTHLLHVPWKVWSKNVDIRYPDSSSQPISNGTRTLYPFFDIDDDMIDVGISEPIKIEMIDYNHSSSYDPKWGKPLGSLSLKPTNTQNQNHNIPTHGISSNVEGISSTSTSQITNSDLNIEGKSSNTIDTEEMKHFQTNKIPCDQLKKCNGIKIIISDRDKHSAKETAGFPEDIFKDEPEPKPTGLDGRGIKLDFLLERGTEFERLFFNGDKVVFAISEGAHILSF